MWNNENKQAAKEIVRARIELQKKRKAEQDKAMQERIKLRQRQNRERQEKMKAALDRAREKREGLEKFLTSHRRISCWLGRPQN